MVPHRPMIYWRSHSHFPPRCCLWRALRKNVAAAKEILQKKLANGEALHKFAEMIAAQGGDAKVCDDVQRLPSTKQTKPIPAPKPGFVQSIECDPNRVRGHRPRRWSSRGGGQG